MTLRFIVDECTGPAVSAWLHSLNHGVFSVYEESRGLSDDAVLDMANRESRIVITNDKDFGMEIYRQRKAHRGVIFLRLDGERAQNKIGVLRNLLEHFPDRLIGQFVVVTEKRIRFAKQ